MEFLQPACLPPSMVLTQNRWGPHVPSSAFSNNIRLYVALSSFNTIFLYAPIEVGSPLIECVAWCVDFFLQHDSPGLSARSADHMHSTTKTVTDNPPLGVRTTRDPSLWAQVWEVSNLLSPFANFCSLVFMTTSTHCWSTPQDPQWSTIRLP